MNETTATKAINRAREELALRHTKKNDTTMSSNESRLLSVANTAYRESTDYFRTYKLNDVVDAYRMKNSQHTRATKFFKEDVAGKEYNHSKFFIPKIYEWITTQKAYAKQALLNNVNSTFHFSPYNDFDRKAKISADFFKALTDYQLQDDDNFYYRFVLSSYEDGLVNNFITAKTVWDEEKEKPYTSLIPIERIRIHPKSDSINIVESSPYIIHIVPMFGYQIKERMKVDNVEHKWNEVSPELMIKTINDIERNIIQARENCSSSAEELESVSGIKDFNLYYIHENFIRDKDGEDYFFYSLGTEKILSKIYKTSDVFLHGRPFNIGHVMLQAHSPYPISPIIHAKPLQEMLNEIQNISIDIKRKVAMPIYLAKKRRVNDLYALSSAKPGSIVTVDDPSDISILSTPSQVNNLQQEIVTSSTHLDDMLGRYGISTAQNNVGANGSVGGIQSQSSSAGLISELYLGTYVETFLEGVHKKRMQVNLEYISDENKIIKDIFKNYGLAQKHNMVDQDGNIDESQFPKNFKEMKSEVLKFSINIGQGTANPELQFQKIIAMLKTMAEMASIQNISLNTKEMIKEQFRILGYRNPSDFVNLEENPRETALMKENMELKQALQTTKEANPDYINAEIQDKLASAEQKRSSVDKDKAEIQVKMSQVQLNEVKSVETGINAQFSAIQGGVALAETTEASGFMDGIVDNALKLADDQSAGQVAPLLPPVNPENLPDFPVNNNPLTPVSPLRGVNKGIETPDTGDF